MDILTVTLIAVGLAMDAFAVSIARGISVEGHKRKNALVVASFFGSFQMIMPVIGWFAGLGLEELIQWIDHWIAFALLVFIGVKMIHDSVGKDEQQGESKLGLRALFTLSIATSIDALMVGLSFAFLQTAILVPIVVIGIVTFSLSYGGFLFGNIIGEYFGNKIKAVGGIILIAIGIKILLEHLLL